MGYLSNPAQATQLASAEFQNVLAHRKKAFHDISRFLYALGETDLGQQFKEGAFAHGYERAIWAFRQWLKAEVFWKLAGEKMSCGVAARKSAREPFWQGLRDISEQCQVLAESNIVPHSSPIESRLSCHV